MEISELEALMEAGTECVFQAEFGGRSEGARGKVVKVGAPLDPDVVWVESAARTFNWDRRTMKRLA